MLLCSLWKEERNVSLCTVTILQGRLLGWMESLIEFILIQTSLICNWNYIDSPAVPTREHTTRSVLKYLLKLKFDWTGFSVWVFFFIPQPYFGIPAPVSRKKTTWLVCPTSLLTVKSLQQCIYWANTQWESMLGKNRLWHQTLSHSTAAENKKADIGQQLGTLYNNLFSQSKDLMIIGNISQVHGERIMSIFTQMAFLCYHGEEIRVHHIGIILDTGLCPSWAQGTSTFPWWEEATQSVTNVSFRHWTLRHGKEP